MSNTVVAIVGGPCVGKTSLIKYIESKFKGRLQADLICVAKENDETSVDVIKRNEAEEDISSMYSFLVHLLQSTMQAFSSSFSVLKPRQFMVIEQSVEFVDLMIHAAKEARLISEEEWTWLRTLTDEFLEFSAVDMFVVIDNDDFQVCENFHKGTKSRKVHKIDSVMKRWSTAISSLLPDWVVRQKARKKYVIEMSPRISRFTVLSKSKQILNAAISLANSKFGTGFPKMASPLDKPDRVEAAVQSWIQSHGRSVSFVVPQQQLAQMPPKKKPSEPLSATQVGDMDDPRFHQEARRLSAEVRQNLTSQHFQPPANLFPHAPVQGYPVQSVAQYPSGSRAQVPPVGRSTPLQGYSSASAPPALMRNVNPELNMDMVFGVEDGSSPRIAKRSASDPGSSSESGDVKTNSSDSSDTAADKKAKKKRRKSAKKKKRSKSPVGFQQEVSVFEQACQEARLVNQATDGAGPSGISASQVDFSDVFPSSPGEQPRESPSRRHEQQRRIESEGDFSTALPRDVRPPGRPMDYGREDGRSRFPDDRPRDQGFQSPGYHSVQRGFPTDADRGMDLHPRATVAPVQRPPQMSSVSYVPGDVHQRGGEPRRDNPLPFRQGPDMSGDASQGFPPPGRSMEQMIWLEEAREAMAFRRFRQMRRHRQEMMMRSMQSGYPPRDRYPSWDEDLDDFGDWRPRESWGPLPQPLNSSQGRYRARILPAEGRGQTFMVQEAVDNPQEPPLASSGAPREESSQVSSSSRQRREEVVASRTEERPPPQSSTATRPSQEVRTSGSQERRAASQSQRRSLVPPTAQSRSRSESVAAGASGSARALSPPQFASPEDAPKKSRSSKGKKEVAKSVPKPKPEVSPRTMKKTAENIKQEKTTPPSSKSLTNTMHSDNLKGMLMNMNTEMELPMRVPGAQHFPQSTAQPPLENLLPHFHSVTFPDAPGSQVVPAQSPEVPAPTAPASGTALSDSMVSISVEELKELRKLQAKAEEVWSDDELMEEAARASAFSFARDEEIRARAAQLQGGLDLPGPSSGGSSGMVPPPLGPSSSHSTTSAPSQEMPSSSAEAGPASQEVEVAVLPSSSSSAGSKAPSERMDKKKVSKPPAKKSTRTEAKKVKGETKSKTKGGEQPKKEDEGPQ